MAISGLSVWVQSRLDPCPKDDDDERDDGVRKSTVEEWLTWESCPPVAREAVTRSTQNVVQVDRVLWLLSGGSKKDRWRVQKPGRIFPDMGGKLSSLVECMITSLFVYFQLYPVLFSFALSGFCRELHPERMWGLWTLPLDPAGGLLSLIGLLLLSFYYPIAELWLYPCLLTWPRISLLFLSVMSEYSRQRQFWGQPAKPNPLICAQRQSKLLSEFRENLSKFLTSFWVILVTDRKNNNWDNFITAALTHRTLSVNWPKLKYNKSQWTMR